MARRSLLEILLGEKKEARQERAHQSGMRKARYSEQWTQKQPTQPSMADEHTARTPKQRRRQKQEAARTQGAQDARPRRPKQPMRNAMMPRAQKHAADAKRRGNRDRIQPRAEKQAPDEHVFYVVENGPAARSIRELRDLMPSLTDTQLHFHTRQHGNDFAAWIRDVFGEQTLADMVERSVTRDELRGVLDRFCYRAG